VRDEGRTKPHIILRNLTTRPGQVFSLQQGRRDIDAIYSMGLFEDVSMRPQPAEGSSLEHPKVEGGACLLRAAAGLQLAGTSLWQTTLGYQAGGAGDACCLAGFPLVPPKFCCPPPNPPTPPSRWIWRWR
jgi:hypothetical protein